MIIVEQAIQDWIAFTYAKKLKPLSYRTKLGQVKMCVNHLRQVKWNKTQRSIGKAEESSAY